MYYLIPRLFGREIYRLALVEVHFWVATIGIVLYIVAMWVAGVMQGLMWRAVNTDGTLTYSFVEVCRHAPVLHRPLPGWCVLPQRYAGDGLQHTEDYRCAKPVLTRFPPPRIEEQQCLDMKSRNQSRPDDLAGGARDQHRGLVEIVPLFFMKSTTEAVEGLKPYTALQLTGRDIYIREGCNVCHSQMIRPFRAETERYGHYSVAGEFVYDRPFLWVPSALVRICTASVPLQ